MFRHKDGILFVKEKFIGSQCRCPGGNCDKKKSRDTLHKFKYFVFIKLRDSQPIYFGLTTF